MKNRAAFMVGIDKMEIREIDMPTPKFGEVLVKLEYVGICGSDVHYFSDGRCGDYVIEGDFILGHECAGTVVELGEGVSTHKIGDRVALEPGLTCGQCEFCKSGRYNICPNLAFLATPPVQGGFKNYIAYPANMAFRLPENISTQTGAFVEPLAVGLNATDMGNVKVGDSVLILGAGCIGLVILLACRAYGASDITIVDVVPNRLEVARQLGATHTINASETDVFAEIDKISNNAGVDKVFEAAGYPATIAQTPHFVKRGGTIVLVGIAAQEEISYNFAKIMAKEIKIVSSLCSCNKYPQTISALSKGVIDISGISTNIFDFDDIQNAFECVTSNKDNIIKAMIKIS